MTDEVEVYVSNWGSVEIDRLDPTNRGFAKSLRDMPKRKDGNLDMRFGRTKWLLDVLEEHMRDRFEMKHNSECA